jgi:hypothetical protein
MIEKGNPPPPDNSVKTGNFIHHSPILIHFTAQLSQMEELVQMVSNGIQELKNDQEYLKMREKTHRNSEFFSSFLLFHEFTNCTKNTNRYVSSALLHLFLPIPYYAIFIVVQRMRVPMREWCGGLHLK